MPILIALLLFVTTGFAQEKALPQQGPPPKNLIQRADGHFTANQDPVDADKFEVHAVVRGETLSQISAEVLRNPRLWPQLWEQNEHIVNPHWIYPNDKILVRPVTQITEAAPPPPPPPPPPAPLPPPPPRAVLASATPPAPAPVQDLFVLGSPKPVPEIKAGDLYCSGFVQVAPLPADLKVIAKYDATGSAMATEANYIYLGRGAEDGLQAGEIYTVVRPTKKVQNRQRRVNDRNLGTHYLEVAQVQVVMPQPDFSLARVIHSCEAIELGDFMIPFQRIDLPPIPRPRPFSPFVTGPADVRGSVVMTLGAVSNFGSVFKGSGVTPGVRRGNLAPLEAGVASEGSIIYVDLGAAAGVQPGDVFLISRPVELDGQLYKLPSDSKRLAVERNVIGEIVVLKVKERASTALVTYSTTVVSAGDSVEHR